MSAPNANEGELEAAVRAVNAAFQTGFELIELCLARETMEHGVATAVHDVLDREITRLWSMVILKKTGDRYANQVKANEEDWTVFKAIAAAFGMDSFRLVDLVATAEAAKRVLETARGVIVCTPTTVPLMDAIDAYDKLTGRKKTP